MGEGIHVIVSDMSNSHHKSKKKS